MFNIESEPMLNLLSAGQSQGRLLLSERTSLVHLGEKAKSKRKSLAPSTKLSNSSFPQENVDSQHGHSVVQIKDLCVLCGSKEYSELLCSQLLQHRAKNPPIAVVLHLNRRIDSAKRFELRLLTAVIFRRDAHHLTSTK